MDPSGIWKFPLLMTRIVVKRFGWKAVIIGWVLSTVAAVYLNLTH